MALQASSTSKTGHLAAPAHLHRGLHQYGELGREHLLSFTTARVMSGLDSGQLVTACRVLSCSARGIAVQHIALRPSTAVTRRLHQQHLSKADILAR